MYMRGSFHSFRRSVIARARFVCAPRLSLGLMLLLFFSLCVVGTLLALFHFRISMIHDPKKLLNDVKTRPTSTLFVQLILRFSGYTDVLEVRRLLTQKLGIITSRKDVERSVYSMRGRFRFFCGSTSSLTPLITAAEKQFTKEQLS